MKVVGSRYSQSCGCQFGKKPMITLFVKASTLSATLLLHSSFEPIGEFESRTFQVFQRDWNTGIYREPKRDWPNRESSQETRSELPECTHCERDFSSQSETTQTRDQDACHHEATSHAARSWKLRDHRARRDSRDSDTSQPHRTNHEQGATDRAHNLRSNTGQCNGRSESSERKMRVRARRFRSGTEHANERPANGFQRSLFRRRT